MNISFDQLYFDCYDDKREAQKEITRIKELLLKCAGYGLVQCFPGWCTKYKSYDETIKGIKAAVVAMREDVKNTPTCSQYWRSCI